MNAHISRRNMLKTLSAGAVTFVAGRFLTGCAVARPVANVIPAITPGSTGFTLPALPYVFDALEPFIDARTMEIHHDKHHQGYVNNLNAALKDQPSLQSKSLDDLLKDINSVPESIRTAIRNNGGGHHNHSLFWQWMKPSGGGEPTGDLAGAINKHFGNFGAFRQQFGEAAAKRFGSGWAWLVKTGSGELKVYSTANQDSPLLEGHTPLLGLDVWEHAYYLKYQNRRTDYIGAWWNVVNWDAVAKSL